MKIIRLEFNGFWGNPSYLPQTSGVYCVYRGIPNPEKNTIALKELLYIGQTNNIQARITNHERLASWKSKLLPGQALRFSYCEIDLPDREHAEAALIYRHKPSLNTEYVYSFPFDDTKIRITGDIGFLDTNFIVNQSS